MKTIFSTIYKISNNLECQIIPYCEIETKKIIRYSYICHNSIFKWYCKCSLLFWSIFIVCIEFYFFCFYLQFYFTVLLKCKIYHISNNKIKCENIHPLWVFVMWLYLSILFPVGYNENYLICTSPTSIWNIKHTIV